MGKKRAVKVIDHDHSAELAPGEGPRLGFQIAGDHGKPRLLD
jgi:hypothetical protein